MPPALAARHLLLNDWVRCQRCGGSEYEWIAPPAELRSTLNGRRRRHYHEFACVGCAGATTGVHWIGKERVQRHVHWLDFPRCYLAY